MVMIKYPNIEFLKRERGITNAVIAKEVGLSAVQLGKKLAGEYDFKLQECKAIQRIFKEPLDFLFSERR